MGEEKVSPIIGLTDRDSQFPEIGSIRKGDKGGTNGAPRDLDYFRVEMDNTEGAAIAKFIDVYGLKPREITVLMPFDDPDRCIDSWRECYDAGALIHRCNGKFVQYAIDRSSGRRIVSNGLSIETGLAVPCPEDHVVYEYVNRKGDKVIAHCGPVMRMRVLIPELRRLAYFVVHSGSIYDIINLSRQLRSIWEINEYRLAGVPLLLRRTEHEISVPRGAGGKKVRTKKWLLSLEADPVWVEKKFGKMRLNAMNMLAIEAPAGDVIDGDLETKVPVRIPGFKDVSGEAREESAGDDFDDQRFEQEERDESAAIAAENPYSKSTEDFPLCDWCGDTLSPKGIPCPACASLGAKPENNPKGNASEQKAPVSPASSDFTPGAPVKSFAIKDLCSWKALLIWGQEQGFYQDLVVDDKGKISGTAPFRAQNVMKQAGISLISPDNLEHCKTALKLHYESKVK